jgi:hypothetical protein
MKAKLSKKLVLKKETVSNLNKKSLESIRAGADTGLDTSPTPGTNSCTQVFLDTICRG